VRSVVAVVSRGQRLADELQRAFRIALDCGVGFGDLEHSIVVTVSVCPRTAVTDRGRGCCAAHAPPTEPLVHDLVAGQASLASLGPLVAGAKLLRRLMVRFQTVF
jgi:hypothetical protein